MVSVLPKVKPLLSPFGGAAFVDLYGLEVREILDLERLRLGDVASGYWTPPFKWSSGQVSHYGSSPSSSARLLGSKNRHYNKSA